jgi:hypothetical protein
MKPSVQTITLLSALFLTAFGAQAAPPNFSGEWKMNIAKSDFGPIPAPDVLTRTIRHNDPSLEYTTIQKGAQGEVKTDLKYTTDGKPALNKIQGNDAKGSAKWQGDSLLIESSRDFQNLQITSKETWTLSPDGNVLTIKNHVTVPQQGEFDLKLVLDKQ